MWRLRELQGVKSLHGESYVLGKESPREPNQAWLVRSLRNVGVSNDEEPSTSDCLIFQIYVDASVWIATINGPHNDLAAQNSLEALVWENWTIVVQLNSLINIDRGIMIHLFLTLRFIYGSRRCQPLRTALNIVLSVILYLDNDSAIEG